MELNKILALVGLIINMIGAFMMFKGTPKVSFSTIIYSSSESEQNEKNASKKNNFIKTGFLLLFIGSFLQILSELL